VFERKLDGVRCLAFRRGGTVKLLSRTRQALNGTYPELVDALLAQDRREFVADGEVVAFEGAQTSFARLQRRLGIRDPERAQATGVPVFYYLFDLLHLDGHDTTRLALRERKALLREAFAFADPLRFLPHRDAEGERFYRQACHDGWEGLIAKRADARYQHSRSRDWLKLKCFNEQEFVIGGYTDPAGKRIGFGALLVGYHDRRGRLRYAGKVGTGYSDTVLRELGARLNAVERDDPPFSPDDPPRRGVHWVEPELVAQIGYTEVTADGKLRHPRFLGLRDDKPVDEVVLETAV
jgi:bifunctional non-homologous end joining protein LigD